jgi:hypothetical protein
MGALEPKLAVEKLVNCVSRSGMPGRSSSVGRDGLFIKFRPEFMVLTVFEVLDRAGGFVLYEGVFERVYGGRVAVVCIVSDRCREKTDVVSSSSPPSLGSVGRDLDASNSPFLMALSSSLFSCWFCFSIAFLIFLPTIRSRRVSTLRRQ